MKDYVLSRRQALKLGAASGFALSAMPHIGFSAPAKDNPIVIENRKRGTTDWQLTRVRPDSKGFRSIAIEGYCSRQSVKAGDRLDIMVSTDPVRNFRIDFYRTGYYGGTGARLVHSVGPV